MTFTDLSDLEKYAKHVHDMYCGFPIQTLMHCHQSAPGIMADNCIMAHPTLVHGGKYAMYHLDRLLSIVNYRNLPDNKTLTATKLDGPTTTYFDLVFTVERTFELSASIRRVAAKTDLETLLEQRAERWQEIPVRPKYRGIDTKRLGPSVIDYLVEEFSTLARASSGLSVAGNLMSFEVEHDQGDDLPLCIQFSLTLDANTYNL